MQMLDLFSGIGGFHKGFEAAGWEFDWVGFSEIDKYANAVYRHRYPGAIEFGDITAIRPERDLPDKLTVLCGGFPCQSFSIAGKRDIRDTRGTLFFEIARILSYYRDKGDPIPYFLLENVKGLYSAGDYTTFATIYGVLADLDYNVECSLENTKYYLPQNRERIYIAGYLGDRGRGQIFPISRADREDRELEQSGEPNGQNCKTLTARGAGEYHSGMQLVRVGDFRTDEGLRIRSDNISPCLNSVKASETEPSWMPPLTMKVGNFTPLQPNDLGRTIRKGGKDSASNKHNWNLVQDDTRIRRLTPIECERLQGFPDGWTSEGIMDGDVIEMSDTQRYKMCGNAVSVPVVEAIAAKILMTKGCDHNETEQGEEYYGNDEHQYSTYWYCLDCGEEMESV